MILTSLLALTIAAATTKPVPPITPVRTDALVGAYYFPGWSHADRWYCIKASTKTWHPLLGYYREGDDRVADWHIRWAAEHGVGFFAFDYYSHYGTQMLEQAVDAFARAKNAGTVRFCLNWCNHAPADTMTAEHLEQFGDLVIRKYMTHPAYQRIGGKPLLIILSGYSFVKTLGVDKARAAFARFEAKCREAGLPGVYLQFCEGEILTAEAVRDSLSAGAQGFCLYNYPYAGTKITGPGTQAEVPYADLITQGPALFTHWKAITQGHFWPTVMAGWDRRPWTKDADLVRTGCTPDLFEKQLVRARDFMNSERIVMIEAWNEWGEGSILEPTTEDRFAYLDRVRTVFAPDAPKHRDLTPPDLGRQNPTGNLVLPSTDRWCFDFDVEGWTATGLRDVAAQWGALHGTATTGDPAFTSAWSFLPANRYGRVTVRMRATPAAAAGSTSARTTGQFFWSTVDHSFGEKTSVKFTVSLDGAWHAYELPVGREATWTGMVDRLRLDPADTPGVLVEIDEILVLR